MKRSKSLKVFFVLAAVLAIAGTLIAKSFLERIAGSDEFRHFAEEKVGEYLKAKVSIGEIKPYRFNQIALEHIIIETPAARGGSQLVRVDRLLFRYHLSQLWNRRFDNPAGIVLRNPSILIEQDQFPYRYFGSTPDGSPGFGMPSLDFKGGEIRYRLPALGKDILLTNVKGRISPAANFKVQIDIRAQGSGVLEGDVAVRGVVDPSRKTHDLWLELNGMNFSPDIPLPFRTMTGKVHWVGKDLFFEKLHASLHGWSADLSGSFENLGGKPEVTLSVHVGKEKPWFRTAFVLNLSAQQLAGSVRLMEEPPVDFEGKVRIEGKRFIADSFTANKVYQGKGELDFTTGNYEIAVERGTKRVSIFSNLRGLDLALHVRLDHFRILGVDLVTQGRIYLHAIAAHWVDKQFRFKGNLETDYFILNQQPFQDLKGSFEINPYGLTGVRLSWGNKFEMTGQVAFPLKKPQAKLTLRVANFDLGEVQFFASKPLPKDMGGQLDGKLLIEGDLQKPEITAAFNVRDGKWGKVDYDRGIIQFRGFPPYFPLEGSKIWRGRSTYYLKGAVDLALDNILAGVKIETPDSLIVWKGLEVTLHAKEGSVQFQGSGTGADREFSPIEVKAAKRAAPDVGEPEDNRPPERGVTAGPKIKF